MNEERKNIILGILRNQYAMFGKNEQPMLVTNYLSFYWDELTELASESEHVQYTPPATVNMWVSGKHEILPSIMDLPGNIGKPVAETVLEPVADEKVPIVERILGLIAHDDAISELKLHISALESAEAEKKIVALESENAALHMENQSLLIKIADLEKRVASLEAQRANDAVYMTVLELELYPDMAKDESEAATSPLPKFQVGDEIETIVGNRATVICSRQRGKNAEYGLRYFNGVISDYWFSESEIK